MSYRVEIHPAALRELHKLPRHAFGEALKAVIGLVTDPRPVGSKTLVGEPAGTVRVRIGDYRIVYVVIDEDKLVTVYRVAHRPGQQVAYRPPGHQAHRPVAQPDGGTGAWHQPAHAALSDAGRDPRHRARRPREGPG